MVSIKVCSIYLYMFTSTLNLLIKIALHIRSYFKKLSRFYIANVIILLLSFNSFSFNTYNTFSFSIH